MAWYQTPIRPFDPVIEYDQSTGCIRYYRDNFTATGQHSYILGPAQAQDQWVQFANCMPVIRGIVEKRWGYLYTGLQLPTGLTATRAYEYENQPYAVRQLAWSLTGPGYVPAMLITGEDAITYCTINSSLFPNSSPFRAACSRSMLYLASNKPIGSGQYLSFYVKWDGTQTAGTGYTTDWGTESVAYPITVGTSGGGNITLVSGRRYYVVQQTKYGHISDLNPVSASTGPLTNQSVPLSNILYNDDTQVTSRLLLATADGGDETLLYLLATLPDNSVSTYTDNVAEADLLASPIYQELDPYGNQIGVADNTPPPFEYGAASFPSYSSYLLLHNGRLYLAAQQSLFFSKNLGELTTSTNTVCGKWEECWPADYVMPVSTEAENITGLLSDGVNLYIGTQRHIRRLQGDGPTGNNPFVYPQVLFNNVGVVNQEVWVRVFQEGAPVGAIWLTPDGRIIMSDFQSYQDIGHPVQDVLNNINYAVCSGQAQTACFAEYFTSDAYDLYMLAVPTGNNTTPDTVLVFDLRGGQWGVWTLTDTPSVFHCNITQTGFPNWYMGSSSIVNNYTTLWRFDSSTLQDRDGWAAAGVAAVPVVSAVQTSWMHFGMPVDRKWLNELEVITEDPNSLISVYGASIGTDFVAPISIVTNQALIQSPFGPYKVYLLNSTNPCKYRYYSFKFQSSSTSVAPMLEAFNAEVIPIHKL